MYKRTVLIVDDQEINRKILGKILHKEYKVLYAEDGGVALEQLKEHQDTISAVVLDIVMPEVDGYEVLKAMSEDSKLCLIPVIVSSISSGDEDEIKALALGAQDFIAKPYKADIIRHRLSNLIRLRESAATINKVEKDPVTGLYNKGFFISKVEDVLRENRDKEYDIIAFGVERFKLVNDAYGTKKGDEVLKYLAGIAQEACKTGDICGRFEADNFYLFRPHTIYTNEMMKPWLWKVKDCPVELDIKLHVGIYVITSTELEVETMCDRAKLAANLNKGKYEQYFSYYDDSLRNKILHEQFILSTMHTALMEGQFTVYYQPKYNLDSEMVVGAEALVRWIHPQKGFMSPKDFIPIFERNGFITQLDRYVWGKTCENIRKWMDMGYPPVAISVNVSRADIYNPNLLDILLNLIAKYEIPIRSLHLEITESAYTENPDQIIEAVHRLKDAGFIIEMDDFGTGYSSLNMLAEMPVDILKLDMRFIQMEATTSSGRGIINFIMSLAKWMNLAVVAEGVETKEQIAMLRSMDCNYVQGFYFAKPMKCEDFEELLTSIKATEMICTNRTAVEYMVGRKSTQKLESGRVMLVVDDMEINRAALAASFIDSFVVRECENGQDAWEYLDKHYEDVEIVMLDLLMPVMDGFQLLSKIRSDTKMCELPVIITSQGDADSERQALAMQANDFISRPYNVEIIRHRVANVVGSHQLACLKEEMLVDEELRNSFTEKEKIVENLDETILRHIEIIRPYFDVVRLVDPTQTMVCESRENAECDMHSCYSIWGKTARCNNCISLKSYEKCGRANKLEYSDKGLFFVISQYVPYGKYGAVLEMVTHLDNKYVDSIFDKDLLYTNLDAINNQLERDDLTGVYNRRHLDTYLNQYIANARAQKTDLGVAMIDIDYFKQLNDTKGHLVGDQALITIARMLEDNIALSKGDFVTRFGGDEFIIVCRDISPDTFKKRMEAVIKLVQFIQNDKGEKTEISISAGCVMLSEVRTGEAMELIDRADHRLYLAKKQGRGRIAMEDE